MASGSGRRTWLTGAAAAVLAATLPGCAAWRAAPAPAPAPPSPDPPTAAPPAPPEAPADAPAPPPLLRPPRLRAGDVVGLFAPSNAASAAQLARGRSTLESLGLRVRVPRHLLAQRGHLAGTVEQRVEDFHALWRDPEVKALWALRGGYGAAAMLPLLDYPMLRRDPKAVIGFSDISALHLALLGHAGLVSYHGPVASSALSPYSRQALQAVLMPGPQAPAERSFKLADEPRARAGAAAAAESAFRRRTLRAGVAEGQLIGGNLSVLAALVGTPYAPELKDRLLFLEEVGETPARIDRLLTQLQQALGLQQAAGLIAGVFDRCEAAPGEPSLRLADVLDDHFGAAGVPAVYGWSFGHVRDQLTLPLGVRARIDTAAETLTLLEAAVS